MATLKGDSPFRPFQPVPVEYFVGREKQIQHILTRGVSQVSNGKAMQFFVQGEYGIGKSSFAQYVQRYAEKEFGLLGMYAPISSARTVEDVGTALIRAAADAGALQPNAQEKIRDWLATYVGEQKVLGFNFHLEKLKTEGPNVAQGPLPFLRNVLERAGNDIKGIFLILDEINGLSKDPYFAYFLKNFVDGNALSRNPIPILLMVCGTEEKRADIIAGHRPVERIFDIIKLEPLDDADMSEFFSRAFSSVGIDVEPSAMALMKNTSAGQPKIMHLIGDCAYWRNKNDVITGRDALGAVMDAAEKFGERYVDMQVYKALQSVEYRSILKKLVQLEMEFEKNDLAQKLTAAETAKLDNFLQRMKKLKVLRSGDEKGAYIFNSKMVWLYLRLREH
jgi:hypothetical protein